MGNLKNNYNNEAELAILGLFGFESKKKGIDRFRPDLLDFLENFAPGQLSTVKRILKKIEFEYDRPLVVDLTMPPNVAGYFSTTMDFIAISPALLLRGTESQIAHVILHECLHAGVYGPKVDDEALVETMTINRITELYGRDDFPTGYDDLVSAVREYFGDKSFAEIQEAIEEGDEETFNNLLTFMVVDPALDGDDPRDLSWKKIESNLRKRWKFIRKYFPRIINTISGNSSAGVHDNATMGVHEFKLEMLLEKAAERIMANKSKLIKLMEIVTNQGQVNLTQKDIIAGLVDEGFAYLVDMYQKEIEAEITQFIVRSKINNGQMALELKIPKIQLNLDRKAA